MIVIKKRDGTITPFKKNKISRAIALAMAETPQGVDQELADSIAEVIEEELLSNHRTYDVEEVQDLVENYLMGTHRRETAKAYIIYRIRKAAEREKRSKGTGLLSDEFLSSYKHQQSPMGELGNFVYYRTYSRWLEEEKRREYWWETVRRVVEYNASLAPTSRQEAEEIYDNMFNLRMFASGRSTWIGGTDVAKFYPMSNFNCAFLVIDEMRAFKDLFYLLMIGTGVGLRITKEDISKLPKVRTNYTLINESYIPVPKGERQEATGLEFPSTAIARITVGDSKEGWAQALELFFRLIAGSEFRQVENILINYDNVRPYGEKLKTFGGHASGHQSLLTMFQKIQKIIEKKAGDYVHFAPIDALDIANIIGENVVIGGVRRTAQIVLIDSDDQECIDAKSNLYKNVGGQWIVDKEIIHRSMSNNSIFYHEKPSREQLHWQIEKMRYSGEPGWVNSEAAQKRRPNFQGLNPCAEILLDNRGMCNLTTLNTAGFVHDGMLDRKSLLSAQRLSARVGYRLTQVELELPHWNLVHERDRLTGVSLMGWQDMVNATGMNLDEEKALLAELRECATQAVKQYAAQLGTPESLLVTTVKPDGTMSQLPGASPGLHYSHSPYYIRRVRINSADPLCKVVEELGYPVLPEVGQTWETATTKVVEFPVMAPEGRTKYDVGAIEQLENYKKFMNYYVQHNASATIHVKPDEWDAIEQWVWDNWDDVVALSFLSLDDSFYDLMPYEAISEEEYLARKAEMKPFRPSLITKYEVAEEEFDIGDESCDSGLCPIR